MNILFSSQFFKNLNTSASFSITFFLYSTLFWNISPWSLGACFLDLTGSQQAQVILLPHPLRAAIKDLSWTLSLLQRCCDVGAGLELCLVLRNCAANALNQQVISPIIVKLAKTNKSKTKWKKIEKYTCVVISFLLLLYYSQPCISWKIPSNIFVFFTLIFCRDLISVSHKSSLPKYSRAEPSISCYCH